MSERKFLDIAELSDNFEYSELSRSGLIWKVNTYSGKNNCRKMKSHGDTAGSLSYKKSGKISGWTVGLNGKAYLAHRVICRILGMLDNENMVVDHIDGNPSNNLISNLRVVSSRTNLQNCSMSVSNTSGINGVSYNTYNDYWEAVTLGVNGERIRKSYSCNKYGGSLAKDLAIRFRQDTVEYLNKNGMNYTGRHGK